MRAARQQARKLNRYLRWKMEATARRHHILAVERIARERSRFSSSCEEEAAERRDSS